MADEDVLYNMQATIATQPFTNAILGPPVCGWAVAMMFFGIALNSFSTYSRSTAYAAETTRIKVLAWVVMFLATAQTACQFWLLYHYATTEARDVESLYGQTVVDCLAQLFVGIEEVAVQLFLARRAYGLMTNRVWGIAFIGVLLLGMITNLMGSTMYLVLGFLLRANKYDATGRITFNIATGVWLTSSAGVDVCISVALIALLQLRKGGFAATDNLLTRLTKLSIETALPVTTCASIAAILNYAVSGNSFGRNAQYAFWQPLPGLYALALLATLTGRAELRDDVANQRKIGPTMASAYQLSFVVPQAESRQVDRATSSDQEKEAERLKLNDAQAAVV